MIRFRLLKGAFQVDFQLLGSSVFKLLLSEYSRRWICRFVGCHPIAMLSRIWSSLRQVGPFCLHPLYWFRTASDPRWLSYGRHASYGFRWKHSHGSWPSDEAAKVRTKIARLHSPSDPMPFSTFSPPVLATGMISVRLKSPGVLFVAKVVAVYYGSGTATLVNGPVRRV